jgi:predicted outer membrane protein
MKRLLVLAPVAALALLGFAAPASAAEDPSADTYRQLQVLQTGFLATLQAADRWQTAKSTGLTEEPGEFDAIHTQLIGSYSQAGKLLEQATSNNVDAHVRRATEATHSEIEEILEALESIRDLSDRNLDRQEQLQHELDSYGPSSGDTILQIGQQRDFDNKETLQTFQSHMDRFVVLNRLAADEMNVYSTAYNASH